MRRPILAVALLAVACGHGIDYSDGDRVGTVTKFSFKGLICKTWEGEMVLGGLRSDGDNMVANIWAFTVDEPRFVKPIQEAMLSGKRVKITYHQGALSGPCTASSDGYFVRGVSEASGQAEAQ